MNPLLCFGLSDYFCAMEKIFRPNPNSFKNTFCVFDEVSIDAINRLEIQYDSKSGSKYYYTKRNVSLVESLGTFG